MSKLSALNVDDHSGLKIGENAPVAFARERHMLSLNVTEITRAIVDFPVLVSRNQKDGSFALSALTSLEPNKNLYATDARWMSSFKSVSMQTYPLFLMKDPAGSDAPVLGIFNDSAVISKKSGEALLDKKGRPSLWAMQQKKILLDDLSNAMLTQRFLSTLEAEKLLREVSINVHSADEQVSQIRGLFMIHEDNLQKLAPATLTEFRDRGYLPAIYAMLFSVFQMNALILKHNESGEKSIKRISLEVVKDQQAKG